MVTATKPIRPTKIYFKDEAEMTEFIKNPSENMDRVREMMQKHQPAKKRK